MKFIIQHNLINVVQLEKIRLATSHLPVVWVGAIPFTEDIESNEPIEGTEYIPYGSCLLSRIGQVREWSGLSYDLTKLNYRNFLDNRPDMLNTQVMRANEISHYLEDQSDTEFFIRPSLDNKQFSGTVMPAYEIIAWFQSMMESGPGSYYMAPETEIVIDTPKEIQAEWRWFIVGGEIISGSMYRAHGQMRVVQETDITVQVEAQMMADVWLPCPNVVMDTALVDGQMKVVEFNCISSSGFYDADIKSVFDALYNHYNS